MDIGAQPAAEVYGWRFNPFSLLIMPDLFTGHSTETASILNGITNGTKFSLVIGPTGSGKTTFLKYLADKMENNHIIYLPKPPTDPADFVRIFTEKIRPTIGDRLRGKKKVDMYTLSGYLNSRLNGKKCILLIDECHEASLNTLEWLRVFGDQINNLSIVFAGLPAFDSLLEEQLGTLKRRITTKTELGGLTKDETLEMIRKRIGKFGGTDIKPFTIESVSYIYDKTGGFPRDILKTCDELAQQAASRKLEIIDKSFLKYEDPVTRETMKTTHADYLESLPEKQREVLEILAKFGGLTPAEIAVKLGAKNYKDKENAVRSTNNIVKRLLKDHFLVRKKSGKAFKYELANKAKTPMVSA